jgi:hypothetical protein
MNHIKIALFTSQILNCFSESKEVVSKQLLIFTNQLDFDKLSGDEINSIPSFYSKLAILNNLEFQFLEFINQYPEKISDYEIENYKNFYKSYTEWRFQ